ncbi:hypothetical protein HDU83_003999 [Entophlyctis luteolus]|nr:hypothetical protein HDU83_003999 [Entophlyctis luteolus]
MLMIVAAVSALVVLNLWFSRGLLPRSATADLPISVASGSIVENSRQTARVPRISFFRDDSLPAVRSKTIFIITTSTHQPTVDLPDINSTIWYLNAVLPDTYNPMFKVPPMFLPEPKSKASIHDFVFGMSTTAERAVPNMKLWTSWLKVNSGLSPPLVISFHKQIANKFVERQSRVKALKIAKENRLDIRFTSTTIQRYEKRILYLLRELWNVARPTTKWFVVQDDDTLWITQDALVDMAMKYPDPLINDIIVGAESEANMKDHGHIAYGGGGIVISRHLAERLNKPSVLEDCYRRFDFIFGGDGIISECVARVIGKPRESVISYEESLHQMDFGGSASFMFEAGAPITSLHHWNTWYSLFPDCHTTLSKKNFESAFLLAHTAKLLGATDFSRRFVFENGKFVVHLGYSIVVYKMRQSKSELFEDTVWKYYNSKSYWYVEGQDKVSYFIISAEQKKGYILLTYQNAAGAIIEVSWGQQTATPFDR